MVGSQDGIAEELSELRIVLEGYHAALASKRLRAWEREALELSVRRVSARIGDLLKPI